MAFLFDKNSLVDDEENPTTYLLRRHYATILSSVCAMNEGELQYLMGHKITNKSLKRSDFLDVDWMMRMKQKLDKRHIFTEPSDIMKELKVSSRRIDIPYATDLELIFEEKLFTEKGTAIFLDLWDTIPADKLIMKLSGYEKDVVILRVDVDYRPVSPEVPQKITIDRAYYHALKTSLNRSDSNMRSGLRRNY